MHMYAGRKHCWKIVLGIVFVVLLSTSAAAAAPDIPPASGGLVVYLNFNEGSGTLALDASGHGNTGTIHGGAVRVENNGCVKALVLDGNASFVSIPYTSLNHPTDAITVSSGFMWTIRHRKRCSLRMITKGDTGSHSMTETISGGRLVLTIPGGCHQ